jgi:hypothetical protein
MLKYLSPLTAAHIRKRNAIEDAIIIYHYATASGFDAGSAAELMSVPFPNRLDYFWL